jgi:hypothetical protein
VPIIDDSAPEGDETITLTLSNPINAVLTGQTTATLTIVDDESRNSGTVYLPIIQR